MTRHASPAAGRPPAQRRGLRRWAADEATALIVIAAMKVLLHMPERLAWGLADLAGAVSYRVSVGRRRRARRNLRRVIEWMAANGQGAESYRAAATDARAFEALVRSAFLHHARYYVEGARMPKFGATWVKERIVAENPAEVDAWLKPNLALVLVGLHFGAIEIPGIYAVSRLGHITSPMETVANPRIQRYLYSTRSTGGVHIVTLEEAGTELLAALRRNEGVGLVADRDLTGRGLEVELFGAKTKIPAGPVLLAAETGAPTYMSAVRRVGVARYRGSLRKVELPAGGSRRERSRAMAGQEARLFEQFIIEAPEQWLAMFHPIWPDLERAAITQGGDQT